LDKQINTLDEVFRQKAVLRRSGENLTYTKGYMIGAMICLCTGKKLAACSGHAPPGFLNAVESVGFECASPLVDSGAKREDWNCAAKQIMEAHGSHKPRQLIERLFYPTIEGLKPDRGPRVKFRVRIEDLDTKMLSEPEEREQTFGNGENVPSCSSCQENLPAMYCETNYP